MFAHEPYDFALSGRTLRWVCAPLRDNIANGNISLQTPVQVDLAIEQPVLFFGSGVRLPGLAIAAHGRTATRVPARPVVDSLCCGKATVVETAHWHVSKSRLSNPFHLTPKKNRYSNEYRSACRKRSPIGGLFLIKEAKICRISTGDERAYEKY